MTFEITKSRLIAALKSVSLPAGRNPMADVPNVLISAVPGNGDQDGSVIVSANNTDLSIAAKVSARVEAAGRAALPAKRFLDLVSNLEPQSVVIATDEKHNANIATGAGRFRLCGSDPVAYPTLAMQTGQTFTTSQAELKGMLARTVFCASTDEARYVVNSVRLDFAPSVATKDATTLTAIGTDLRRLATVEVTVPGNLTGPGTATGITVPRTAALKIRDALTDDGEVTVQYDSTCATVAIARKNGTVSISTVLIGGNYPKYTQWIPGNGYNPTKVTVNRKQLLRALVRVSRMVSKKDKVVSLRFRQDKLRLTTLGDVGDAKEEVGVVFNGKEFSTDMNLEYITSALKVLPGDVVDLLVTNGVEPLVMKSTVPFLYVALPMRRSP